MLRRVERVTLICLNDSCFFFFYRIYFKIYSNESPTSICSELETKKKKGKILTYTYYMHNLILN